jgi:hypothetical protein
VDPEQSIEGYEISFFQFVAVGDIIVASKPKGKALLAGLHYLIKVTVRNPIRSTAA